jgi:hypothetical protein
MIVADDATELTSNAMLVGTEADMLARPLSR